MSKIIEIIIAILKKSPIVTLGVALTTTVILLLPDGVAKGLGLYDIRNSHKWVFSIIMILSWGMCISYVCFFVGRVIKENLKAKKDEKERLLNQEQIEEVVRNNLQRLNPDEKACLLLYVNGNVNTVRFEIGNSTVEGLAGKGILNRHSGHFDVMEGRPYSIRQGLIEYLQVNAGLLESASRPPRPPGPISYI